MAELHGGDNKCLGNTEASSDWFLAEVRNCHTGEHSLSRLTFSGHERLQQGTINTLHSYITLGILMDGYVIF